jgi:hypothetical protein
MNKDLATALGRLDRYLFRVKRAVRSGDLVVALSDTAELAEVSRRLWTSLERTIKASSRSSAASDPDKTKSNQGP